MSAAVSGTRFIGSGRDVEEVEISVNIVGDRVFLAIQGRVLHHYHLDREAWEELMKAAPHG
jgi:hypothetical protein